MIRAIRTFLHHLVSPHARTNYAIETLRDVGLSDTDARFAALDIWHSCRTGRPLSPRTRELLAAINTSICDRCGGSGEEPFDDYLSQNPHVHVSCDQCGGSGRCPKNEISEVQHA